jgi:hypothetical protein
LNLLADEARLQQKNDAVILAEFSYGYGIPMADLSDRFNSHLCLGFGINYQPARDHFNFGSRFGYFFGSDVKEDVLQPFRTDLGGLLIGIDGYLAEMQLKERGFFIELHTGGLFPVFSQEGARQSIKWQLGAGYLEHHIRFVDDARALNQFTDSYLEGLDRLTNGFAITSFLGYEFLSRKGWLCFFAGVEPILAFTSGKRNLNYDTNLSDLGKSRTDILLNFKLGIYLPFYLNRDYEKIEY